MTQQGLWLLLFVALGPLLGPKPYGLFGLAVTIVGLFEFMLADGAAEALLSLDEAGDAHYGVANLINGGVGLAASAVTILVGAPLGLLIHEPSMVLVMAALSPLPVLSALSAAPIAYLKRHMQFRQFALRSIVGLLIGSAFGVVFALRGAGIWALVIQILAQRAAEVAILWLATPQTLRLSWGRAPFEELRHCAVNVALARGWIWVTGQAPRLIIGAIAGPAVLGFFIIASRIADVLVQVVLVPATQVARLEMRHLADDRASAAAAFEDLIGKLFIAALPMSVGVACVSHVLFRDWLGAKWVGGDGATALMALTVLPWIVFYCGSALFMGLRLSWLDQRIQLILALTSAATAAAAAPFGLEATCAALLLRLVVLAFLPIAYLKTHAGIRFLGVLRVVAAPLAAAAVMGLSLLLAANAVSAWAGSLWTLPLLVAMGCGIYVGLVALIAPQQLRTVLSSLSSAVLAGHRAPRQT